MTLEQRFEEDHVENRNKDDSKDERMRTMSESYGSIRDVA